MAIKGSLEALGLEDLLGASLTSEGDGRLTLRCAALFASLYLTSEGIYVQEPDLLHPDDVLDAFVARGVLSADAVDEARQRDLGGARLLDHLIREGALPEAELMEVLAASAEDTVLDLMLWEEGQFRFDVQPQGAGRTGLQGRLCVDPGGVLERALARIDERAEIAKVLGLRTVLILPIAGELPPLESDDDPLHEVFMRLDGQHLLHDIALYMGCGRFRVLQAAFRLVAAGLARPATTEELIERCNGHLEARRFAAARALALQWAELAPAEPGPLVKLASVAEAAGNRDAELDALCALGHLHVVRGNPREAVSVFTRAMRRAPADDVVLAGLRIAAEAAGDDTVYADSTLLTAQAALDEDKAEDALELLEPLVKAHPENLAAHLLRARALVVAERRAELLEHAEVVGQVLSRSGARSRQARDAAVFFRETIAEVAPERGDLLERFRSLTERGADRWRKVALLGCLTLLLAVAGVLLWPASAASMLAKARAAADRGDTSEAERFVSEVIERFPESQEAEEAYLLKARLLKPVATRPRRDPISEDLRNRAQAAATRFRVAVPRLPDAEARQDVLALVLLLEERDSKPLRKTLLPPMLDALRTKARTLLKGTLERVAVLAESDDAHERYREDPDALEAYIERALAMRGEGHAEALEETARLLTRIAGMTDDAALRVLTQELARVAHSFEGAVRFLDAHIQPCQVTLATVRIEAADRLCRESAPKLFVNGALAEADALYEDLERRIAAYAADPIYGQLTDSVRRRQLPRLVRERRTQIANIHDRIEEAREAERSGDLPAALRIYSALIQEYWLIRFENVFQLPLRVETVPPGARILLEGTEVGRSPTIVRYPWAIPATLTVQAPGFAPTAFTLQADHDEPMAVLTLRMPPEADWSIGLGARVETLPLVVDGHVLVVDRAGRTTLYDRDDGGVRWSEDFASLEGVRCRPAAAGRTLYLARVDGTLLLVDLEDGSLADTLKPGRPTGDLAAQDERVALLTKDGALLGFYEGRETWRAQTGEVPTAGVLGAHGAFWVGTAAGGLLRVDARTGVSRRQALAPQSGAVIGLAASPRGVLVSLAGGILACLEADGTLRWKRPGMGNAIGAPAVAGQVAAVTDRRGRVSFFDRQTGDPVASIEIKSPSRHGLVGIGSLLMAACDDGRLWAYDTANQILVLDAKVGERSPHPPQPYGSDRVLVGAKAGRLWRIPIPRTP